MSQESDALKRVFNLNTLLEAAWTGAITAIRTLPSEFPGGRTGTAFLVTFLEHLRKEAAKAPEVARKKIAEELEKLRFDEIERLLTLNEEKIRLLVAGHDLLKTEIADEKQNSSQLEKSIQNLKEKEGQLRGLVAASLDAFKGNYKVLLLHQEKQAHELKWLKEVVNRTLDRGSRSSHLDEMVKEMLQEIRNGLDYPPPIYLPQSTDGLGKEHILQLLRFSERWVPLVGREKEIADLHAFANDGRSFVWHTITGNGGAGKSRLALEWLWELRDQDWDVGFYDENSEWMKGFCDAPHRWSPLRPTAIVLDYAHRMGRDLPRFIHTCYEKMQDLHRPPLRVLVLDRPSVGEAWWRLTPGSDDLGRYQSSALASCYRKKEVEESNTSKISFNKTVEPETFPLPPLQETRFKKGLIEFCLKKAGDDTASLPEGINWNRVDDLTNEGQPLFLSILGVALAIEGASILSHWTSDHLLEFILERELQIWKHLALQYHTTLDAIARDVGFVTLCGNLPVDSLHQSLPLLSSGERTNEHIDVLRCILEKEDGFLSRLEPDILGSFFLLTGEQIAFGKRKTLSFFDACDWLEKAFRVSPKGTTSSLFLLVRDFADHAKTRQIIEIIIKRNDILANTIDTSLPLVFAYLLVHDLEEGKNIFEKNIHQEFWKFAQENLSFRKAYSLAMPDVAAYFARNQNGEYLFELEQRIDALRKAVPQSEEIALSLAQTAYNIITGCSDESRFDLLERWGSMIQSICGPFKNCENMALTLAQSAANAMHAYGEAKRFADVDRWGLLLQEIRNTFSSSEEIALAHAKAASNAICFYGEAGRLHDMDQWGNLIRKLREAFPKNEAIALAFSKASINAISGYGKAGQFDELEQWGLLLQEVRQSFNKSSLIAVAQAKASVNAIRDYGIANRFEELECWAHLLFVTRKKYPESEEIALTQAQSASNAICGYGRVNQFHNLERWGELLNEIQQEFSKNSMIALAQAQASCNAIRSYGKARRFADLERWRTIAEKIFDAFQWNDQVALKLAQASFNSITSYGEAKLFEDMERSGLEIQKLRSMFSENEEIATVYAEAAFNAFNAYGEVGLLAELTRWGEIIHKLRMAFPESENIAIAQAKAATNAIFIFGKAGCFRELEQWRNLLQETYRNFFKSEQIALEHIKAVYNRYISYSKYEQKDYINELNEIINILIRSFSWNSGILKISFSLCILSSRFVAPLHALLSILECAEKAPWILPHKMEHPVGLICIRIAQNIDEDIPEEIHSRICALTTGLHEMIDATKEFQQKGQVLLENDLRRLWSVRLFLPNWGKYLWEPLLKAGHRDWIQDALQDDFTSPDEKARLRQMMD